MATKAPSPASSSSLLQAPLHLPSRPPPNLKTEGHRFVLCGCAHLLPPTRQPPWPQDRSQGTRHRVRSEGHPWPSRVAQLLSLQSPIPSLGLEAGPPSVYPNDSSPLRPCEDPWLHSPSCDRVSKTFSPLNILFQNPHVHPEP